VKRWSTDRRGWPRVPRQQVEVGQVGGTTLVYLKALEVREPLSVSCCGQQIKIMDVGYQWLSICEKGARHIVTAHCNAEGKPVHWYTDIIDSWGVGEDGFPYFDNLYLDVIALPGGQVEIIDGDELEAALEARIISRTQYELVWREAEAVTAAIKVQSFRPVQLTRHFMSMFAG
jgi:predicted RNA-binding protein associated with RNAse of E/G family